MKRNFICLLMGLLILVFSNSLWAACPEDTSDLGYCDTLHVRPWSQTDTCITRKYCTGCDENDICIEWTTVTHCINNPGSHFPCFMYVNLLVTHDSNTLWYSAGGGKWVQDSIASIIVPLTWTRTNKAKYCSLSTYWNSSTLTSCENETPIEGYPNRAWRNFPQLVGDSINLIGKLKWSDHNVVVSSDSVQVSGTWTPPHAFISLIAGNSARKWFQERDTLLATLTFRIEDSMTICIDTTCIPPGFGTLQFVRYDAGSYIPRHKMPFGIRVNGDGTVDTCRCPGTDVRWIDGSTEEGSKPTAFLLSQNYPNPFNPVTNFKFSLPKASHVQIEIFNILGQKVKTLVDQDMKAGSFLVDWDGKDQRGVEVSSGIYFYRMTAEDFSSVKRMVLLK
jgi:hypothetical protein